MKRMERHVLLINEKYHFKYVLNLCSQLMSKIQLKQQKKCIIIICITIVPSLILLCCALAQYTMKSTWQKRVKFACPSSRKTACASSGPATSCFTSPSVFTVTLYYHGNSPLAYKERKKSYDIIAPFRKLLFVLVYPVKMH